MSCVKDVERRLLSELLLYIKLWIHFSVTPAPLHPPLNINHSSAHTHKYMHRIYCIYVINI